MSEIQLGMIVVVSVISLTSLMLTIPALYFGIRAYIEIKAMQNSTHNIQLVPAENLGPGQSDELINKGFDKVEEDMYEESNDSEILDELHDNMI